MIHDRLTLALTHATIDGKDEPHWSTKELKISAQEAHLAPNVRAGHTNSLVEHATTLPPA